MTVVVSNSTDTDGSSELLPGRPPRSDSRSRYHQQIRFCRWISAFGRIIGRSVIADSVDAFVFSATNNR